MDNSENDFLWKVLANPADPSRSYVYDLQFLVNEYPQSGILRALLVPKGDDQHLKHAAAYFTPGTLYKMVNNPDSIQAVSDSQIAYTEEPSTEPLIYVEPPVEDFVPPVIDASANYFHVEEAEPQADMAYVEEEKNVPATEETSNAVTEDLDDDSTPYEEIAEAPIVTHAATAAEDTTEYTEKAPWEEETATPEPIQESLLAKEYEEHLAKLNEADENVPVYTFDNKEEGKVEYFHQDIDDEVYDEIVSIEDIGLEQLTSFKGAAKKEEDKAGEQTDDDTKSSDHFVFETTATDAANDEPASTEQDTTITARSTTQHAAPTQKLSRYNDEKMPYSFMWWLDKTRKEHAARYQPYVTNRPAVMQQAPQQPIQTGAPDELQQQYYENIFNVNSIAGVDAAAPQPTIPQPATSKEGKIIERFIQEEPQIKHPSMIKLNNENKAKRSSEDRDELVTETLARIYTEQMLYHKAILTYKKLMLKFPEKSLYFAGQIEQLESKIN
jgi:hypothetical protein